MKTCAICGGNHLRKVNSISFGVWNDAETIKQGECHTALTRDTNDYDLVECEACQHVQMSNDYQSSLFEKLYFHSEQEEVMWHESLVGDYTAYLNMVEFTQATTDAPRKIVDFGCGTGSLLRAFKEQYGDNSTLYGIDFNPRCHLDFIQYMSADLNQAEALAACKTQGGYDLACASHTLEHVLDPVNFLVGMRESLSANGKIFIEVPDFSYSLRANVAGQSNLVNLQHIHYFTASSLSACAKAAGLQVIALKQVLTGYIPRLMAMLAPLEQDNAVSKLEPKQTSASATEAVNAILQEAALKRATLANIIKQRAEHYDRFALWGIGADFYLMCREHPELAQTIEQGNITLFDYEHAGKYIAGKQITNSESIQSYQDDVYLMPLLAETRVKMHKLAKQWQASVVDTYAPSILDVEGLKQQSCQVCQSCDWQKIDTLASGVWQKQTQGNGIEAIVRDEMLFEIGLCKCCGHTQAFTPYSQQTFNNLYFSSDQQPEMWHVKAGQKSPYFEMLDLFFDKMSSFNTIADFGCGEGLLMREMKNANPQAKVLGFDFNIQGQSGDIARFACDLNNYQDIERVQNHLSFDLVTTSHVLEHVINPVMYLQALKSRLSDKGLLFIEVPDASACSQRLQLHSTNLVHGQHIHYYTSESLENIAARAGLKKIAAKQFVTGDIPRLQMLFEASDEIHQYPQKIKQTAHATVKARFEQYNAKLDELNTAISEAFKQSDSGKIGLWGIGGDFYQWYKRYSSSAQLLEQNKIVIYDYNLQQCEFEQQAIHSSEELDNIDYPVVLCPMYYPTRSTMKAISANWSTQIVDPYSNLH